MDIKAELKAKMEEIVEKIKSDKDLLNKFSANPIGTVEELIGMDLPDDQIEKLAEAIKAKLDMDKVSNTLGSLGKLFGK